MKLLSEFAKEVQDYTTRDVEISNGFMFSQHKLVKRISLYENKIYKLGKTDSQGNYKYWFDIISPRRDAEVKNIDFDTKNISVYSERKIDELPVIVTNLKIKEWLREKGEAEKLNSAIEEFSGWGNVVWKKVKGGYERVNLKNFYVINQVASCLDESAAIEHHELTQSDLREKMGVWENVQETIDECGEKMSAPTGQQTPTETTNPYYDVYERNGEVCLADLKEAKNVKIRKGDDGKYVLAKVVFSCTKNGAEGSITGKYILFADEIKKPPYIEAHRGPYKGRWLREGLIELLMDCQTRANEIGNQIARGLEFASKTIFTTPDKLFVQNIITDLKNGDILRSEKGISHVPVRMDGFDQLVVDWNRIIQIANEIANSREVVQGDAGPSGTPYRTTSLLNENANKLFDFIREKLGIALRDVFDKWILPVLVSELKAKEIIRLTGDSDMLDRLYKLIVESWYLNNLLAIGPHDAMTADLLKTQKLDELKRRPQLLMSELDKVFADFQPRACVEITGEGLNRESEIRNVMEYAKIEGDPVRRTALIEIGMKKSGIDVAGLPKSPAVPPVAVQSGQSGQGRTVTTGQ